MNSTALLALIGDLYAQLAEAQERIAALEHELAKGADKAHEGVAGSSPSSEPSTPGSATLGSD